MSSSTTIGNLYIYIYIYICVCVCVCMCVYILWRKDYRFTLGKEFSLGSGKLNSNQLYYA